MDFLTLVKQNLKSRTFWLNIIALALGILAAIEADLLAGVTLSVVGVLGIILRNVTTLPVMEK